MRYVLLKDGVRVDDSGNSMLLIDRYWNSIRGQTDVRWSLLDTAPRIGQHCSAWAVAWSADLNGVELSPLVGGRDAARP